MTKESLIDDTEKVRQAVREGLREAMGRPAHSPPDRVCPYIISSEEGTSYCSLAEQNGHPTTQTNVRWEPLMDKRLNALIKGMEQQVIVYDALEEAFLEAYENAKKAEQPYAGSQAARTVLSNENNPLSMPLGEISRSSRALAGEPNEINDLTCKKGLETASRAPVPEQPDERTLVDRFAAHIKAIPLGEEDNQLGASAYNWGMRYLVLLLGLAANTPKREIVDDPASEKEVIQDAYDSYMRHPNYVGMSRRAFSEAVTEYNCVKAAKEQGRKSSDA